MPASLRAWYTPAGLEALAVRQAELEGEFSIAAMPRLAEYLGSATGAVTARFAFSRTDPGWIRLEMTLRSRLGVVCQRCLGALDLDVSERVELAIVADESRYGALPASLEPVEFDGERLSLQQLVEDEMIVAVPLVPRHAPGRCQIDADSLPEGVFASGGQTKTN